MMFVMARVFWSSEKVLTPLCVVLKGIPLGRTQVLWQPLHEHEKKSTSTSAFFNSRVLISLFVILAGISLALLGLGAFSAIAASSAQTQQKQKTATRSIDLSLLPPGFDCSTIHQKGIDKQDNMRAGMIMIACGLTEGGSPPDEGISDSSAVSGLIKNLLPEPLFIGGSDVDVILPIVRFLK